MIYLRAEVIRSTRRDDGRSTSRPRDATPPSSCDNKENLACCSSLQSSPCFGKLKVAKPFRGWRQSGPLPLLNVLRRSLSILTAVYFPPSMTLGLSIRANVCIQFVLRPCTAWVDLLNPLVTNLESARALSQQPENHDPQTPLNLRPSSSIRQNSDTAFGIPIPEIRQRELQVQYLSQQSTWDSVAGIQSNGSYVTFYWFQSQSLLARETQRLSNRLFEAYTVGYESSSEGDRLYRAYQTVKLVENADDRKVRG